MNGLDLFQDVVKIFVQIWNLELFVSGSQAIRLNQILVAFFVIVVGVLLSRKVSRLFAERITKTGRLDSNIAHLLQKLISYFLFVVIALIALPIAGIPITILTVLGGAFAIGIGFGAQNLFNNLISGVIIMLEQPIRIGDIVEIQQEEGRIEDIGNRCVCIRRTDGVDVLVPNSYFIEQPVVNWTLSDSDIRGTVTVGVAYGSPVESVRDLLASIADRHPNIHSRPEPVVLFEDFGNSALSFTLLFWTRVSRPMDLRKIQSDIRYQIDALFKENGITIAFPQQDIHFDAGKPLEVKITNR